MADVARTAIVSKESHNGLLVEDAIKNNPIDDSNHLTECSVANHTNNCSNRNSCYESKDGGYQEIDSFSELSFKTTDEISLQDLIESEFAARISTINGDDCWTGSNLNKSRDPFDDLFEDYDGKGTKGTTGDTMISRGKDFISSVPDQDAVDKADPEVLTNLDDFISGPMKGDTSLITQDSDSFERDVLATKSVNIFKMDHPEEMPILTNFDPFTAIEEDSDSSHLLTNSDVLNSPDEFPFPESLEKTKGWDNTDDSAIEVIERRKSEKDYDDGCNNDNDDDSVVNKSNDVMRELFTKTISDENLDDFTGQNYELNDGNESKLYVGASMDGIESGGVSETHPRASRLLSQDKIDVDQFYSSEDILKGNGDALPVKVHESVLTTDAGRGGPEGPRESDEVELFIDDDDGLVDNYDNDCTPSGGARRQLGEPKPQQVNTLFVCENEDKWTTVEEALKAQPENFELEGDSGLTNDTNDSKTSESSTNDVLELTTEQTNGLSDSDSEAETKSESVEKKTVKKKKSKKGKKSDEKENISVDPVQKKSGKSAAPLSTLDDLEDLSNVSVKNLMLTYSSCEGPRSLQNRWCHRASEPVPLQNLKARSMVDLTSNSRKVAALRSNLFQNSKNLETSRSSTNLSAGSGRNPVVTGVSVQALKSSFSKFDQLSKKTILHVRSVDASKVQKQFNEASTGGSETTSNCKSCGKQVFQMEQIKAEKSVWHKNCFRCKECNKQLSVDTYSSNEGILYCKPHFKELFKPKAVLDDESEPVKVRKPELIIRENEPIELPPEVVRASDKPDLGLEELASLNVKSRYQMFEKGDDGNSGSLEKSPSNISVKRSPSILSKLAKFQKKGIDVGVRDEDLNGLPMEQSSASSDEEEEEENEEETSSSKKVVKSKKVKERPMSFSRMDDVKSVWENGVAKTREEMREERKAEIHHIRSKLFMGKQVKMKEAYEQAVRESENSSPRKSVEVRSEKAKSIKECFEKGEPLNVDDDNEGDEKSKKIVDDDMSLFEAGISKKSRSIFLELDKSAKTQSSTVKKPPSPSLTSPTPRPREVSRQITENIVKSSDALEDVQIETADISSKFKFFETYKEPEREKKQFRITPPREGQVKTESPEKEVYRDPNVVRASDKVEQEIIRTNTTAKMLSLFRQMEEKTEEIPEGPKPLKRFTPPPDYKNGNENDTEESEGSEDEEEEDDEEEEEEEEEVNSNIVRASDKVEDEYLKQAASAARAKQLRAKFEKWEEKEKEKEREELAQRKVNGSSNNAVVENSENVEVTSIECTKSLRARFESMKGEADLPKEKVARPKVNRFVEIQNSMAELCDVCRRIVYQLEKVETSGKIFHRACFRCMQCNCLLRMESFTLNCGNLYCLPHFKQKFISKGNYDEGFGVDQHKAKWPTVTSF